MLIEIGSAIEIEIGSRADELKIDPDFDFDFDFDFDRARPYCTAKKLTHLYGCWPPKDL